MQHPSGLENTDLLETDSRVVMKATTTLEGCPEEPDVPFVPGGAFEILEDREVLRSLANRGPRARYVMSVCEGSLVLGAAGLLDGYKATSPWSGCDAPALFGATPVKERVVTDRNRISGGTATAGIDFGLVLLAELLGDDVAKMTRLALEYDPAPPFDAGTPEKAGPAILSTMQEWLGAAGGTLESMLSKGGQEHERLRPAHGVVSGAHVTKHRLGEQHESHSNIAAGIFSVSWRGKQHATSRLHTPDTEERRSRRPKPFASLCTTYGPFRNTLTTTFSGVACLRGSVGQNLRYGPLVRACYLRAPP